jgi:RuvB-like protein 2
LFAGVAIDADDERDGRFLDEKRSVQFLKEQNSLLIGEDGMMGAGTNGGVEGADQVMASA